MPIVCTTKNIRRIKFSGKVGMSGFAPCGITTHNGVRILHICLLPLLRKSNIFGRGSVLGLLCLVLVLLSLGSIPKSLFTYNFLLITQKIIEVSLPLDTSG